MPATHLRPYLPMDRRHALASGAALPDRTQGAALFADISGFTPLTGALAAELGRQRGAEVVLDYINPIYEALIGELYRYHGSVIGFAGDSITCWLDRDDGRRGVACALAMQAIMRRFAVITTPGGAEVTLSIKIAVASGPARRFLVGDPRIHNFEALAGATLERMAAAEHQAERGDVVVSAEVVAALGDALVVTEWRHETDTARAFAVVTGLNLPVEPLPWPELPLDALSIEAIRPWIDVPVYARLASGAAFIAELRPVTSLFLKFGGIDYDGDDDAGRKLDAFVRWVQGILARYEGYMLQLTIGDKGSNLLAVFGAPVAHDDDMARAVAAALDLHTLPPELHCITPPQIGVSQGLAWAGACGGRLRCIYTVMGDEVNMAARLMGKAAPGQILVNQHIAEATARSYHYNYLGAIPVKGRVEPLPVSAAIGRQKTHLTALFNTPLVGREEFLETLHALLHAPGQILRLEGVAGVGKSHLAAVFAEQVAASGWQTATGLCQSISQGTAYTPWRQLLLTLLGLAELPEAAQIAQLREQVADANPTWETRLPLLGEVLGLPLPDNALTAGLDPKLRQQALSALVAEIVQTWAARQPLLLVLEDVHWLDEASAALTVAVARALYHSPAALLLVQRPPLEGQRILPELAALPAHHYLPLDDLTPEGVAGLVRHRLGGEVGQLALDLIFELAQGNPFFTEELVDTLCEAGYVIHNAAKDKWRLSEPAFDALLDANCVIKVDGHWQMVEHPPLNAVALDIPDSVHGTVLARIDRLPEAHKLTLKVASVIGRTFQLSALQAVHPATPEREALHAQIAQIGERDFVRVEAALATDPVYIFKHNTTQEVAYDTLLFAQRQQLHAAVGTWYERTYGDGQPLDALTLDAALAVHYPVLAHHWRNAEQPARERVYAGLAGEQAAKQFANEGALRYFSRALELTPEAEAETRYRLLLGREGVYDVMGQREPQAQDVTALQALAAHLRDPRRQADVALREANYARFTGDYPTALAAAQTALAHAQAAADRNAQARSYHEWGRLLWQQGQYDASRARLQEALALARVTGDQLQEARSLYDIATAYYEQGDYPAAERHYQQALPLYQATGYRRGEIDCQMMFGSIYSLAGRYVVAQKSYEQALATARTIGWRMAEAFLLSNLGHNFFEMGDYEQAEQHHRTALAICREIGNLLREAISLDTLSLIAHVFGENEQALAQGQVALNIQQQLGNRRSEGYVRTHLGLALEELGRYEETFEAFQQALQLRRELGQEAAAIDDLAGLARVALALGKRESAHAYVEEILAWLAANSPDGIEFPVLVYLSCYQVLTTISAGPDDDQHARDVLETGYALLQQRAGQIQDEAIRRQFLENVPFNRVLREAWEAQPPRLQPDSELPG